jgi:hypothetical protein
VGWLAPFGSLWIDGYGYDNAGGLYYRRRAFTDYASAGPATEIDVGVRLSRRYNVFALWEHGFLGKGNLDGDAFGGQEWGASNLYGVGLRFSTDPGGVGFLMEVALGYRDFRAYWADGTELHLTDGWLDARLGLGADIRLTRWLSLTPLVTLGGGSFGTAEWRGPGGTRDAHTALDDPAEYGFAGIHVGAHVDLD